MFHYLFRKLRDCLTPDCICPSIEAQGPVVGLSASLTSNLEYLRQKFSGSTDLIIQEFKIEGLKKQAGLIHLDGLIAKGKTAEIVSALTDDIRDEAELATPDLIELLSSNVPLRKTGVENGIAEIAACLLAGDTVLLVDGLTVALVFDTKGGEIRAIAEPVNEALNKGPHQGFVESLPVNISLLRRRINNADLVFTIVRLGKKTRTEVGIAYLKGVAPESLVVEVQQRLKRVNCDRVLGTQDIEEYIKDTPFSPFRTVAYSERPEVVASKILEGKVAVFIDGLPVVLTVPMLFMESMQNPDDYNVHFYYGTLIRWLRYLAYVLSIFTPALYVALLTYHMELVPSPLLLMLVSMEKDVPFSPVVEAVLMGVIVEILRMGGIWLPRLGREIVSILVLMLIGLALVNSHLVAVPFVAVVAITLFASFAVPFQEEASVFVRLFLVILAGTSGLFGMLIGLLLVLMHLISLRSFGIAYLTPLTPFIPQKFKDSLVRGPAWLVNNNAEPGEDLADDQSGSGR